MALGIRQSTFSRMPFPVRLYAPVKQAFSSRGLFLGSKNRNVAGVDNRDPGQAENDTQAHLPSPSRFAKSGGNHHCPNVHILRLCWQQWKRYIGEPEL